MSPSLKEQRVEDSYEGPLPGDLCGLPRLTGSNTGHDGALEHPNPLHSTGPNRGFTGMPPLRRKGRRGEGYDVGTHTDKFLMFGPFMLDFIFCCKWILGTITKQCRLGRRPAEYRT